MYGVVCTWVWQVCSVGVAGMVWQCWYDNPCFFVLQPSVKGIAHLVSLCQSLTDSGSMLVGLIRPYHSRLRACQEMYEKALKERLDICTAFVEFEDAAEQVRC